MPGIAQKLFEERYSASPWTPQKVKESFLIQLIDQGLISHIDAALSSRLMNTHGWSGDEVLAFLCHLSHAVRNGHLCIEIYGDQIIPSIEDLTEDVLESSFIIRFKKLVLEGSKKLWNCINDSVIREEGRFYLFRQWELKSKFQSLLNTKIINDNPRYTVDIEKIKQDTATMVANGVLLPEQAQAVLKGAENALSFIIGGPGTGKTYTAGILLRLLWEGLDPDLRKGCRIALAAPTGKAASQLESSIKRALGCWDSLPHLRGETLHSLLGVAKKGEGQILSTDILLVDECSMIDGEMMVRLFESLKPGSRLIMLGDPFQLPPVEVGTLFADMIESGSQSISLTELSKCMRSDQKEILDIAKAVNAGDANVLLGYPEKGTNNFTVSFVDELTSMREIQKKLINTSLNNFRVDPNADYATILKSLNSFRVLSPLRHGPLGVDALNGLFYQAFMSKHSPSDSVVILPIMIAANNHRLSLFNGEIGLLVRHPHCSEKDFAVFISGNGEERQIPALLLPKYEYAFCLSVHKSQGSEFDHVLLLYPKEAGTFGREALYTGITRAKKKLELWGDRTALEKSIGKSSLRHSGIEIGKKRSS